MGKASFLTNIEKGINLFVRELCSHNDNDNGQDGFKSSKYTVLNLYKFNF